MGQLTTESPVEHPFQGHARITVHAPAGAPGIFDDEAHSAFIVHVLELAIAYYQVSMPGSVTGVSFAVGVCICNKSLVEFPVF